MKKIILLQSFDKQTSKYSPLSLRLRKSFLAKTMFQSNSDDLSSPTPYQFSYSAPAIGGGSTHEGESGDAYGRKTGTYTVQNEDGSERVVQYVADEDGFRASIATNEPGTANQIQLMSLFHPVQMKNSNTDSPSICRNPCSPISTSCTTKTVNPCCQKIPNHSSTFNSRRIRPFIVPIRPSVIPFPPPTFIDQPVVFPFGGPGIIPQDQIY
ncbi:hypothetical protein CEXT_718541 [Caerostris extrusa]|uniref:Uncharacterized protein n=1 Tax=Caerostris extrusa TaxID=172846 RepID=A0AAV4US83_CAEEX|nr:hypothetical protein CEXT_718541 [Caerostris extrusa]